MASFLLVRRGVDEEYWNIFFSQPLVDSDHILSRHLVTCLVVHSITVGGIELELGQRLWITC